MDWTQVIVAIIGTGILTTVVNAIISRKERASKTTGLELQNLKGLIDMLTEKISELETKQKSDREESHKYIGVLREEILDLRRQRDADAKAMLQAYRCKYPEDIKDCPVIKAQAENTCSGCPGKND